MRQGFSAVCAAKGGCWNSNDRPLGRIIAQKRPSGPQINVNSVVSGTAWPFFRYFSTKRSAKEEK